MADVRAQLEGEDEEHARRFGWHPARSTEESVRSSIERGQNDWANDGPTRAFAVREKASGRLVGGCELRLVGGAAAEISYWIYPPYRGRGFARRALKLVLEWSKRERGINRFVLRIERDNIASRRLAASIGFVLSGEERDGDGRLRLVYELEPGERLPG